MNDLDVLMEEEDAVLEHISSLIASGKEIEARRVFMLRRKALLAELYTTLMSGGICHKDSFNGKLIKGLELRYRRDGARICLTEV